LANSFYLDASALAKRYVPEPGSAHVYAILNTMPRDRLRVLNIGMGEIVSILVRKRNAGAISQAYFGQAMLNFDNEIRQAAKISRVPVTSRLVTGSISLIVAHSINSTDALVLKSALAIARRLRRAGEDLVLVASDQRLLRAAQAEGLTTFDPETQDQAALAGMIGP
jgi:predicted nucleic acid-binding protein